MKRTIFVVGAGASTDFGLPLGSQLAVQIRDLVAAEISGTPSQGPIFSAAMASSLPGNYGDAARNLAGGLVSARSVDRLLDSLKDRPLVIELGKCGIAAAISLAEEASYIGRIRDDEWLTVQNALVRSNGTWLARLFGLLQEGKGPAEARTVFENCAFITFNYDRCIERYLRLAFPHVLDQSSENAAGIVDAIPIIHVYGSLGSLPDHSGCGGVPYGPPTEMLREAAKSVRTFTEGAVDGTLEAIERLVDTAEILVFLGFAFDPLNVGALFRKPLRFDQSVTGTDLGIGPAEWEHFKETAFLGGEVQGALYGDDCASFVLTDEFRSKVEI